MCQVTRNKTGKVVELIHGSNCIMVNGHRMKLRQVLDDVVAIDTENRRLDYLTKYHTAFKSFTELVESGHIPTLRCRTHQSQKARRQLRELADAYDFYMQENKHKRRAERS